MKSTTQQTGLSCQQVDGTKPSPAPAARAAWYRLDASSTMAAEMSDAVTAAPCA